LYVFGYSAIMFVFDSISNRTHVNKYEKNNKPTQMLYFNIELPAISPKKTRLKVPKLRILHYICKKKMK